MRSPPETPRVLVSHLGMDGVTNAIHGHDDVSEVLAVPTKSVVGA